MAKQVKTKNKCSRCQDAFLKGSIRLCNYCGCENDESGKYEVEYCFPCVSHPFEYFLKDRFPIAQWIRKYRPSFVAYDFLAGLTVGLMLVPQAIAYASIAKLPLRYGLYSGFMACFVYVVFGTSKDMSLGPTAILSLLTASLTAQLGDDAESRVPYAIALTLLSGIVQVLLGIFNLGWIVDFVPVPVISGFTSAAAIQIAIGQLKSLFGISISGDPAVYTVIYVICKKIKETKVWDFLLGLFCIVVLVLLKIFKTHIERLLKRGYLHLYQRVCLKFVWILCCARNALVVFCAGLIGYCFYVQPGFSFTTSPITLINFDNHQFPKFIVPQLNGTIVNDLKVGIVVTPLIAFLETMAIGKAFARKNHYKIEPSQELIALGICNVASSFVGSYPVTGSFSRTAVNAQTGVKTPAAGIITGAVVLFAIGVVSHWFRYIPKTSLAAVIMTAVLQMVDFSTVWRIMRVKPIDNFLLAVTFFLTLFLGIEYGVPIACVISILLLLYRHARPRHKFVVEGDEVHITFNGGWDYAGVDYLWTRVEDEINRREQLQASRESAAVREKQVRREDGSVNVVLEEKSPLLEAVVIKCSSMSEIDYTVCQSIKEHCVNLEEMNIPVRLVGKPQDQVKNILLKARIKNLEFIESVSFDGSHQGNLEKAAQDS